MAAILPTQVIPGVALLAATDPAPSQGIFIPLANLPGLSAAEANPATGDGRALALAITNQIQSTVAALADNAKPTKMTVTRGSVAAVAGQPTQGRISYTLTFDLTISPSSAELAPEA